MVPKLPSDEGRPVPETVAEQSILQQAQAAAAAQTISASPAGQEAPLQKTDLCTPDLDEDDVPPPPYGEIYGEIGNEKDGLGTSARVTDDGRVNIRINQLNRRLSQVLTPALRQQVQDVKDSRPPPPPYIPPSLGGEEGIPPTPPLNIVIQVVGSRGDVQPFIALGKVLKGTYGHRVRLATHPNFKDFVQENGLEFFSIGGDPSQLMAFMVKNPSLMPGLRTLLSGDVGQRRRDVAEYIQGCWRSCYEAGDGTGRRATNNDVSELSENEPGSELAERPFVADCIIANPPSFAHIHCAEKLGIPLHIMFTMPYSPTQAFPHPLANIQSSNADAQLTNYISYAMIEALSWQGLGDIINRFRAKCLGLEPVSLTSAPGMLQRLKVPHTYCWSPALIPKPKDWGPHISISGFYLLNLASEYTPPPHFQAFLDAGPPPVYIGFGSIVLDDPDAMTELIFEAVRKTGQRVLLSKGWGGMGPDGIPTPHGVFMLGNVPHDWLFKHVSCVVHHGGAGTTAAGITAGRPTVIVPFFGDQHFWGAMVARAGAGPNPIPHRQLTADRLADAISFCLKPESLERAKALASKIAAERGSDMGAQSFHQYLEADRLRCTLAPSRAASWRIKHTQVRLSPFAACTLANANLLDFHDLKLFRAQEYYTDEGPWDPIVSGGFTAICRAFSSMALGVAELPSETLKPLYPPFWSSRQHSQGSVSTIAGKSEISDVGGRSTSLTSPEQGQTSLNKQDSLARVRSPSNLSRLSSPTLNLGSSSTLDALQGHSNPKQDYAGPSRVRSRNESNYGKKNDMLRHTGVHGSRGLGRILKATAKSPMDIAVGITSGFHNFPKLWGDDTVRPQEQISGIKSGAMAAGKEFGYGWYDGVTGLVTQPWNGARKDGVGGFAKGIGKGILGFVAKPNAALMGVLGHTMKGVHKEVQKLFGSNVQNYIIASRVAQGYEEWLQSSEAEKQDVINRWKLIRKYLKKKHKPDEMMQDMLDVQRKKNMKDAEAAQTYGHTTSSAQFASADAQTLDSQNPIFDMSGSKSPAESSTASGVNEIIRHSVDEEASDNQAEQEQLRQAIAASEIEAQRHASEALEFKKQLKRVMAQSLGKQRQSEDSDIDWEEGEEEAICLDNEDNSEVFNVLEQRRWAEKNMITEAGVLHQQHPSSSSSYDPGMHLSGTTRSEFKTQQQGQRGEKSSQEKTEEEVVMEYVKKQSLLEQQVQHQHQDQHQHQNKGKARATTEAERNGSGSGARRKLQQDRH